MRNEVFSFFYAGNPGWNLFRNIARIRIERHIEAKKTMGIDPGLKSTPAPCSLTNHLLFRGNI